MTPSGIILSADQFLLVSLLVKIGVMASLATILVRYRFIKKILLVEDRGRREDWQFAALFGALIALGVILRLLVGYTGADISLPGILLIGLLTGPLIGSVTGALLGLIPTLSGEMLAAPVGLLYGLIGGLVGKTCPTRDAVWNFSPLTWINVYRFLKSNLIRTRLPWQISLILACIAMETLTLLISQRFSQSRLLFSLRPESFPALIAMYVSAVACLGIPLKIWNSTRIETLLEKQEALVNRARFEALRSQINPHFLFNTLNSIAVTIRTDPPRARQIVLKLSNILRRLLHTEEDFVPLREELGFIDAYLDIERVRFGQEKLRIERDIDPASLDIMVPGMMLQPLVENAIKHGLGPKIEGGLLRIMTRRGNGHVLIEVEDDGMGVPEHRLDDALISGIGLSNVRERLLALFGQDHRFTLDSKPNQGTRIYIEIPDHAPEPPARQNRQE